LQQICFSLLLLAGFALLAFVAIHLFVRRSVIRRIVDFVLVPAFHAARATGALRPLRAERGTAHAARSARTREAGPTWSAKP